jgi:HK97 family phage major capsid protein
MVPDLWSAQIWEKVRQDNVVLPLFRAIDMPSNPFELPVEGTDPTVYYVSETQHESQLTLGAGNPIPDSKIGSGKVPLHAKKLALRVGISSELVEDSILPVLAIYRQQAQNAIAEALDNVLLNGDTATTATGNINSDHTTPTSGSAFFGAGWLAQLPIVTDTDRAVDMGNLAPTLAKLRQARFRMPTRYSARPDNLAWVVDGGTYASLLEFVGVLTMDKAGALATAQTGQIGFLDGIPVFVSSAMPLTEADGKVGATTNERGTACASTGRMVRGLSSQNRGQCGVHPVHG